MANEALIRATSTRDVPIPVEIAWRQCNHNVEQMFTFIHFKFK